MSAGTTPTSSTTLNGILGAPVVHEFSTKDASNRVLLVLHGGPGMEHSYLVSGLVPLSERRRLLFYDQLGSGEDRTPVDKLKADALVKQVSEVIDALRSTGLTVGVLAHSWGTYLALEALARFNCVLSELILVNPQPLNWSRFVDGGGRLMSRVPPHLAQRIETLEAEGTEDAGLQVMDLALPAYLSPSSRDVHVSFASYRPAVNAKIFSSIESYDQTHYDFSKLLPERALVVYGTDDFNLPEDTRELWDASVVVKIQGAGHFPFYERSAEFVDAVLNFLG